MAKKKSIWRRMAWWHWVCLVVGLVLLLWVGPYFALRSVVIEPYGGGEVARVYYFDKTVQHCHLTKGRHHRSMYWGLRDSVGTKGRYCRLFIPLERVELFLRGSPSMAGPAETAD